MPHNPVFGFHKKCFLQGRQVLIRSLVFLEGSILLVAVYGYELIILNFPLKVSLWMGTAWTYLRSLVAFVDVTAVPALPA